MAHGSTTDGKAAAKLWLKAESRHGRKAAWPVVIAGLVGTASAIGQAYCAALVLGAALLGDVHEVLLSGALGFAALALLRVAMQMVSERFAFAAGAAARRRLRSDALSRLLHAGPAVLGGRHSGDLAAVVVDKVEALDGLFANWLPASSLALAAPLLVMAVAFVADPFAAMVLGLAGLLVPFGMAAAGIGAATAFRRQFLALSRLQARFPVARQLVLAVRQMERMGLAVPVPNGRPHPDAADHQLEALRGVIEIPVAEADTLLLVFAGTNNRLWMTFSLLHKLLRKTQISIVYCRDLRRDWYASGVVGVGGDFASTVHGFRDLATAHGARRILTLGNCVGCGGALRFGLALGAQGVLGLGPKLQPNDALKPDQKASLASIRQLLPSGHKAARIRYREADSRPAVSLIYGERCGADAAEARSMADIPGIEATAIPESADPDSVKDLLVRGLLEPVLHDFVCHGRLSPELRARIASSRTPQS